MRAFDCFVGIDWSGDRRAAQKGIKVAIAKRGFAPPLLKPSANRNGEWSRSELAKWIGELVSDRRALIGLDFAFGFPVTHPLVRNLTLNWEYVEKLCGTDGNFYGGQFFRTPNAVHSHLVNSPWLPGCQYSAHCLRATELAAKRTRGATPQSIFNAYGAAQVGPASISGMRVLLHLQKQHGKNISIWPFDEVDDTRSVIVEVFPRYFPLSQKLSPKLSDHSALNAALNAFDSQSVVMPPASEDEGDAIMAAAALRTLSADATVFDLPDVSVRSEGWIFGVPFEGNNPEVELTREQILEIERRLSDDEPIATDREVRATFNRLTK